LSVYEASIGSPVQFYGSGFDRGSEYVAIFTGNFDAEDGSEAVDLRQKLRWVDGGTLEWTRFGPYDLPFSQRGARTGVFYGTVTIERTVPAPEGVEAEVLTSEPLDLSFEVLPSIIVREFQPITANCAQPAGIALGGAAYRMSVQTVGLEPVRFTYTLAAPDLEGVDTVLAAHVANGRFDTIGERGDLILPEVPDDSQAYDVVITVQAEDAEGRQVASAFAVGVRRPIEVFYNGNVTVAEFLAPEPVSACTPGAETGRAVTYNETQTETRQRSYSVSWDQSWRQDHTVAMGSSETVRVDQVNGVGFGTTDGRTWNWDVGVEGGINIQKVVELGMSGSYGEGGSRTESQNRSRTDGVSRQETTTNTESRTNSEVVGAGEDFSWSTSSSESIARGFGGTVLPETYGVFYRQAVRLLRRAVVVTYNQCGAAQTVAEVDFTDWTWAADLALGNSCPPFPQSNLPAAECVVPPCVGE